jgi:hypothetical protein
MAQRPFRARTATAVGLLALLLGIACGGPTGPTPVPTTVEVSPGSVVLDGIGATRQLTATVRDQNGAVMPGVTVEWSSSRNATVGVSSLGLVTAVSGGVAEITATAASAIGHATVTVTDATRQFNIVLRYITAPAQSYENAFTVARDRWQLLISGDVPAIQVTLPANTKCGDVTIPNAIDESVDDVVIYVDLQPIDGPGNVIGSAGPCYIRSTTGLPILGGMKFDTDDLDYLNTHGLLDETIVHEMGHVLGFGTVWTYSAIDLLRNPSDTSQGGTLGADTHFVGPKALLEFDSVGGSGYTGAKVPVENDYTEFESGSLDSHWRESVFGTELMTPLLNGSFDNPLSAVTAAAIGDIGYTVNYAAADSYALPGPAAVAAAAGAGVQVDLGHDIASGPVYLVDTAGRVVGAIRR